jgi:hypothetical protein
MHTRVAFLFLVAGAIASSAFGQQNSTNRAIGVAAAPNVFPSVTDEGAPIVSNYWDGRGMWVPVRADLVTEALKKPECRPADLDREGHWGTVVSGWQLGVRTEKNAFAAGEKLPAMLFMRNVTTNDQLYFMYGTAEEDFPVTWSRKEDGARVENGFSPVMERVKPGRRIIHPKTQRPIPIKLEASLPTKQPGTYTISLKKLLEPPKAVIVLTSGEITIQITNSTPHR